MAFNPRPEPGKIISNAEWRRRTAIQEVKDEGYKLKPLPSSLKPIGKKVEYYIELWKVGCQAGDKIASQFKSANVKHVLTLILATKQYTITYLERMSDGYVIWDKR